MRSPLSASSQPPASAHPSTAAIKGYRGPCPSRLVNADRVFLAIGACHRHEHDLVGEPARLGRRGGPGVGAGRVLVHRGTAQLPARGDDLRRDALVDEAIRVAGGHGRAEGVLPQRGGANGTWLIDSTPHAITTSNAPATSARST